MRSTTFTAEVTTRDSRDTRISRKTGWALASRVAAALPGGYAFAWGLNALLTASLFAAGLEFHDAEFLGGALGILAFLTVFLSAFVVRRIVRLWLVLACGGALMTGAASWVQSLLLHSAVGSTF
jgi:hypothetical protein